MARFAAQIVVDLVRLAEYNTAVTQEEDLGILGYDMPRTTALAIAWCITMKAVLKQRMISSIQASK
jgi:hypothetical protein